MTAVIFKDAMDAPLRLASLRQAWPHVHAVCPAEMAIPHARRVTIPPEWLPAGEGTPRAKTWHKADGFGHAAAATITADFYWFIESDASATPQRWRAMIEEHQDNPADLLSNALRERKWTRENPWWAHPGTPDWADCFFLMPVFRLSAAALRACIAAAEELRECFCEVAIASTIRRAGLSMAEVCARQTHWNRQTFAAHPAAVIRNPLLVNHPIKSDSLIP